MDVEDEADDEQTDTSQAECQTTGCDLTADSSYIEVNDENKENSISDSIVELLL